MDRHKVIKATVLEIVNEVGGPCDRVDESQLLVDQLGLSSLHLARIVAVLELELGVDPFSEQVSITSVRTVGDLMRVYDQGGDSPGAEEDQQADAEATADRRRAVARGNRAARLGARTDS
ncbi:acyl carrier protein [Streptomyces sp. NPDC090445]|uniref:acyl carrier protein n=1 Tax=Streptomyces sp. NPDC090445 TaxID=3365963 RepID=UPI0037F7607D